LTGNQGALRDYNNLCVSTALYGLLTCLFGVYFCWTVSLVENDRPPSFQGALDAGDSGEIPSSFLHLSLFLLGRLRAVRPSASNARRWNCRKSGGI